MKQAIPTYDLSGISQHRFFIERIENRTHGAEERLLDKGIHRDTHYIFTCMESGYVKMMVDFKTVEAEGPTIFCVLPGQVHQGFIMENVSGWFVAVKSELVPDMVRSVFEESLVEIMPLMADKKQMLQIHTTANTLYSSYTDEMFSSKQGFWVIQSLLNAFLGMFAFIYTDENKVEVAGESRALQLSRAFRILVRKQFRTLKSPSEYAEILNITRGYLTEVIREITGKPAQHWIHQEVLIEAKRLLVFTSLTVKEIAYELGYNDHTYFTRLFSKLEDQSPSEFRSHNKK